MKKSAPRSVLWKRTLNQPKRSETARFERFACKRAFLSVFIWEPSNYIKHIITSEKERSPSSFVQKSTELTQMLRNSPEFSSSHVNARILGWFCTGTIQLHQTHHKKWKRALPEQFCGKEHWINPNVLKQPGLSGSHVNARILGYSRLGTIQIHRTNQNKWKIALPEPFCTKERWIHPNAPKQHGLSRSNVNALIHGCFHVGTVQLHQTHHNN